MLLSQKIMFSLSSIIRGIATRYFPSTRTRKAETSEALTLTLISLFADKPGEAE